MMTLAELILREGSIAAAARRLQVSRQTVDRWLKAKFKPSLAIVRLAEQQGVDLQTRLLPPLDRPEAPKP